jgi:RHS repeat-associated protein
VEIDWPAKTMWHSYDRRTGWVGPVSWMGSLIQHGRDPSGQLYRRNRYYDPSTGVFTQEDPIGLAGGINLYGFANGDPVTYSDPYGLKVKCNTQEACDLWNDLRRRAINAKNSDDEDVRQAGHRLLNWMGRAQKDRKVTYTIDARQRDAQFEDATGGGQGVRVGPNEWLLLIDTERDTDRVLNSPWINLAHELGGAMGYSEYRGFRSWFGEWPHNKGSLTLENAARRTVGCSIRRVHPENILWSGCNRY